MALPMDARSQHHVDPGHVGTGCPGTVAPGHGGTARAMPSAPRTHEEKRKTRDIQQE